MFHTSVKTDKNVGSVFHSLATKHQSRNRDQVEVEQVSQKCYRFTSDIFKDTQYTVTTQIQH